MIGKKRGRKQFRAAMVVSPEGLNAIPVAAGRQAGRCWAWGRFPAGRCTPLTYRRPELSLLDNAAGEGGRLTLPRYSRPLLVPSLSYPVVCASRLVLKPPPPGRRCRCKLNHVLPRGSRHDTHENSLGGWRSRRRRRKGEARNGRYETG